MAAHFKLQHVECKRCGRGTLTGIGEKLPDWYAKWSGVCVDCTTPQEMAQMLDDQAAEVVRESAARVEKPKLRVVY